MWLIIAAIVVVVAVYILRWLYRRSTKETAFVRTGFMGEKVVVNGGAFVIPVLHEITPVNMNVCASRCAAKMQTALITKNRMRVDLIAEFFVRVGASREPVAAAAQTLGRRTLQPEGMRELLEGKFSGGDAHVAAQMTLEEMHELRGDYAAKVQASSRRKSLAANGLELESVAIVDLDQTSLEFFDPSNAFDAEGLTQLTESIETRRRMRNEIEQRTLVDIRNQNLDTQRKVLEIDRDSEYARLEQEREVEIRRAGQRSELAKERALRDQESEQAQLSARESGREVAAGAGARHHRGAHQERGRDAAPRDRTAPCARRGRAEDARTTEREQIALELDAGEGAHQPRGRAERAGNPAQGGAGDCRAGAPDRACRKGAGGNQGGSREAARRDRREPGDRNRRGSRRTVLLDRSASSASAIWKRCRSPSARPSRKPRSRPARKSSGRASQTARGIDEARLIKDREIRQMGVERDKTIEIAEIQKAIDIAKKTQERSAAMAASEAVRAKAIQAEEQSFTAREREIAERRKLTDLIGAQREAERETMRVTSRADAEMKAAKSLAEAQKIAAIASADAEKIHALAAAERYAVDAAGQKQINEAENVLSDEARAGRLRGKLLDHIEGIVRESVKPMEKIEGIKILHVDGMNGGPGGNRNVTDEVIDSALRYRVQAPMIDNLMKEIGIEGGSLGRMTDVLRDAKDISSLTRDKKGKPKPAKDDDDDRDH